MAKEALVRLKVDSKEYDSKIERARSGLLHLEDSLKDASKSFKDADAEQVKFARSLGSMPTVVKTARGAVSELTKAYTDLKMQYDHLSEADKKSDFGKGLLSSLDQLKTRIKDSKAELKDIDRELNEVGESSTDLSSILGQLGQKFGISSDLLGGLTTGTIAYTAAIGAAATAVAAAAKAWAEYNTELAQQDNATMVVTGLKGGSAEAMTSMGRAISKTYGVDFRQTIEAANTLMSQFGTTSEDAMKLLRDGMQGMIQGDGPKLLQMIQQYAPPFRDAGVSASQLVAVIQNSEGGIFTDQNMSAIVMGIKNIRLMTNQTSEALAKMGIDGGKMTQQLNEGSITVFDALKQVAGQLKNVNSNSQAAGEVMQTVFGRQGAMAGTNLAKAIDTLNTNLEETKTQTGEVGEAFSELERANERLEVAMRNAFEYDGWQTMTTSIKTELTDALTGAAKAVARIRDLFEELGITGDSAFAKVAGSITKVGIALQNLQLLPTIAALKGLASYGASETQQPASTNQGIAPGQKNETQQRLLQGYQERHFGQRSEKGNGIPSTQTQTIKVEADTIDAQKSIKQLQEEIRSLTKLRDETTSPKERNTYNTQIASIQDRIKVMQGGGNTTPAKSAQVEGGIKGLKEFDGIVAQTTESLADLRKQLAEYQAARDTATNTADYAAAQQGIADTQRRIGAQEAAIRLGVDTDSILEIEDKMKEELENMKDNLPKLEIKAEVNADGVSGLSEEGTKAAQTWAAAAKALSSAGSALQQIEDPGVKIAGIVGQAVANIALGFAQAAASPASGALGVFGWIAAATAGLATMVATIASIKSATAGSYEQGGIIPGSSYSGDHLTVAANSGELILTRSQQDNIAAQLQSIGNVQSMSAQPYTTGENIVLGINNHFKRSGQGEIVTTGMLRKYGLL